ncbi:MAG: phosphotransferase family protein, partial [Bacteroidota bacterium]
MPQQVRKGEELHRAAVLEFLQQRGLIGIQAEELGVTQYTTGFSNLTYLLQAGDQEFVLRRPPAGAVKRGHDMSREFKVLTALNQGFSQAPKAYAYTDDLSITGSSFYVMEKVEGIILTYREAVKRNISPLEFMAISEQWLSTFVALHQLDYRALGLGELGRPEGYVERQVHNWGKQYLKAKTEEIPAAEQVMAWLEENQPTSYNHALIHNDYKYDNVVFADDTWQELRAVLDWEMCTLGDPLMDLGTSLAYWSVADDGEAVTKGWPSPTILPGNPSRDE